MARCDRHNATEAATGNFGWALRPRNGDDWGRSGVAAAGMGMVEGHWTPMHSTRAEARGLLSGMRAARRRASVATGGDFKATHLLDNGSVVKLYKTVQDWTPLRWLKVSDKDT